MKQTVEEAARENILFNHRTADRTLSGKNLAQFGEINFIQGAEWQSKQSPWISVEERLPEYPCWVLVTCKEYKYRILFYCEGKFYTDKSLTSYDGSVLFWIPIPSLDKDL